MAAADENWEVERIGPPGEKVRVELGDDIVRLTKDGETVAFRVDDDVAEPIGRSVPTWAESVADRIGVTLNRGQ